MVEVFALGVNCHEFWILLFEVFKGLSEHEGVEGFRTLSHAFQLPSPFLLDGGSSLSHGFNDPVVGFLIAVDDNVGDESHLRGLNMKVAHRKAFWWVAVQETPAVTLGEIEDLIGSNGTFDTGSTEISPGLYNGYASQTLGDLP
jgi:hypothetical protein